MRASYLLSEGHTLVGCRSSDARKDGERRLSVRPISMLSFVFSIHSSSRSPVMLLIEDAVSEVADAGEDQ